MSFVITGCRGSAIACGLVVSVLTLALPSQQIAMRGGPTSVYQLTLREGAGSWAATVPSNALAPWDYSVSHAVFPWIVPAYARSQGLIVPAQPNLTLGGIGFTDGLYLLPTVSGAIDRHEKLVVITGPEGQTTDFYVQVDAAWLTAWQAVPGTGLITMDVEGFGLTPDVQIAFPGYAASVTRTVGVRLGPLPGGEIRVRITTEFSMPIGLTGIGVTASAVVSALSVNGSYSFEGGYGCGAPVPDLVPLEVPRVGQPFRVDVLDVPGPNPAAVMLTGFSNTRWQGNPLPWDASPIGMTGCLLRNDITFSDSLPVTGTRARWTFSFPGVTTSLDLRGLNFFQQAAVLDAAANPLGVVLSHAYRGVIGK